MFSRRHTNEEGWVGRGNTPKEIPSPSLTSLLTSIDLFKPSPAVRRKLVPVDEPSISASAVGCWLQSRHLQKNSTGHRLLCWVWGSDPHTRTCWRTSTVDDGAHSQGFSSGGLGWGPRRGISDSFLGDAVAAGPRTTLQEPLIWRTEEPVLREGERRVGREVVDRDQRRQTQGR